MKRIVGLLHIVALFMIVGIDQWSKSHFASFEALKVPGTLDFVRHMNPGFVLQSFSDQSVLPRIVFVCSLYGFLLLAFGLFHLLAPTSAKFYRWGVTLFFAAVTGNCWDRALHGAAIDFIQVSAFSKTVIFNFADAVMWVGMAVILYSLFTPEAEMRFGVSKRKTILLDHKYQLRYGAQFSLIALSAMTTLTFFSYTYIVHAAGMRSQDWVREYWLSAGALGIFFSALVFVVGVFLSHRSVGPLYAFESYLSRLIQGDQKGFSLRSSDDHQRLLEVAKKIEQELKENKKQAS